MNPSVWLLALFIAGRPPDLGPVEYHIPMPSERVCRDTVRDMRPIDGAPSPVRVRCLQAVDLGKRGRK